MVHSSGCTTTSRRLYYLLQDTTVQQGVAFGRLTTPHWVQALVQEQRFHAVSLSCFTKTRLRSRWYSSRRGHMQRSRLPCSQETYSGAESQRCRQRSRKRPRKDGYAMFCSAEVRAFLLGEHFLCFSIVSRV
jgi:hypothetical protein